MTEIREGENHQVINLPEYDKNFSIFGFKEYLHYLQLQDKTKFIFSDEWNAAVASDPKLCLDMIHLVNFLMDEPFTNLAVEYALQALNVHDIEQTLLIESIRTFSIILNSQQYESFLDILFRLKRQSFKQNNHLNNEIVTESLNYIVDHLPDIKPQQGQYAKHHSTESPKTEMQLLFKTLTGQTIWLSINNTDNVQTIKEKLALRLSDAYQIPIFPQNTVLIFRGRELSDHDVTSAEVCRHGCIHAIVQNHNIILNEETLYALQDETLADDIQLTLITLRSITEKILNFNNNFGNQSKNLTQSLNDYQQRLIKIERDIKNTSFIKDRHKENILSTVKFALHEVKDSYPHIQLYLKLFDQGLLIGNIPKDIKSIENLIKSELDSTENIIALEDTVFRVYSLIRKVTSAINVSGLNLTEAELVAREMLDTQIKSYQHRLKNILQFNCAHIFKGKLNLFEEKNLLEELPIAIPEPVTTPKLTEMPAPQAPQAQDSPFIICIDHGGVLDGQWKPTSEINQVDEQHDLILKQDAEYFMYLPYGKDILKILKELSEMGCIITSHSSNNWEDQLNIWKQIFNAAPANNHSFKLGRTAIYNEKLSTNNSDNPTQITQYDLGYPIETYTFGPGKKEGKNGLRDILVKEYQAVKENLFILDDSEQVLQNAVNDGFDQKNCFWITGEETEVCYRLFDKHEFLVDALHLIKQRITALQEARQAQAQALHQNQSRDEARNILMEKLRDICLQNPEPMRSLFERCYDEQTDLLFEAAAQTDSRGYDLFRKIVENVEDKVANELLMFFFVLNSDLTRNYIFSTQFETLQVECLSNNKSLCYTTLSNLFKPKPLTPLLDHAQGVSNLGKRNRDSDNQEFISEEPPSKKETNDKQNRSCAIC